MHRSALFLALITVVALPAHAGDTIPADVKEMNQVWGGILKKMSQMAADEWSCTDPLTFSKASSQMIRVQGCGKEVVFGHVQDSTSWYPDFDVRKKAPFELSCDAAQLTYVLIDERNRGVEGCGKKAMYVIGPNGWLMNSTSGG